VIPLLAAARGDVNVASADSATPLHVAVTWNNAGALQALLSEGALPMVSYHTGLTAPDLAEKRRDLSAITLLRGSLNRVDSL